MKAFITGTGVFLPDLIVSNEDLSVSLEVEPDWILKASGIRNRRWASPPTTTSLLASGSLRQALADSALEPAMIDYLLMGTMTPDRFIPGTAYAVQSQLGLAEIPCLDIRATCCNALYGLQLAKALVVAGTAKHVAIVLAELQSRWLRMTPADATISMLFGDGAATMIVSGEEQPRALEIIDIGLWSNGAYADDLGVRSPGTEFGIEAADDRNYAPRMKGQSVILQASRRIVAACETVMKRNGLTIDDVSWIVPHQANANLLAQIARALKFQSTERVVSVLEQLGNTSSASMGIALDTLQSSGAVGRGDYVLLPAFGAGFTWGAGLCRALP